MGWTGGFPSPLWSGSTARSHPMPTHTKLAKSNAQIAVIGIDIGKNVFHLIGLDSRGAIVLKCKLSRSQLENRLAACRTDPWRACSGLPSPVIRSQRLEALKGGLKRPLGRISASYSRPRSQASTLL